MIMNPGDDANYFFFFKIIDVVKVHNFQAQFTNIVSFLWPMLSLFRICLLRKFLRVLLWFNQVVSRAMRLDSGGVPKLVLTLNKYEIQTMNTNPIDSMSGNMKYFFHHCSNSRTIES